VKIPDLESFGNQTCKRGAFLSERVTVFFGMKPGK
jgi:hypothetical protein